jgi:hypothetical protein
MSRQLRARITAAKTVLDSTGAESLIAQTKLQCSAVLEQIQRESLSNEQAAEIGQLIEEVPLAPVYKKVLLDCLGTKGKPHRRKAQDFTCALGFFADLQWKAWLDEKANPLSVRNGLIGQLLQLNCINPTEPTLKLYASLWMLLTEGPTRALIELSSADKCTRRDNFKTEYAKQKTRFVEKTKKEQLPYVEQCWESPSILKLVEPALYERVYGMIGEPVKAPISLDALIQLDASYGCRGEGRDENFPKTDALAVIPSGSSTSSGGDMQQAANFFMEGLTRLGEQQQRMFQMMCEGRDLPGLSIKGQASDRGNRPDRFERQGSMEVQTRTSNALSRRWDSEVGALDDEAIKLPADLEAAARDAAGGVGADLLRLPAPETEVRVPAEAEAPAPEPMGRAPEPVVGPAAPQPVATPAEVPAVPVAVAAQAPRVPTGPVPAPVPAALEPVASPVAARTSHALLGALLDREGEKKRRRITAKTPAPGVVPPVAAADGDTGGVESTPASKKKTKAGTPVSAKHREIEADDGGLVPKVRYMMPKIDIEKTRFQYLGRTGFRGPGESKAFVYNGATKEVVSQAAAEAAAKAWLKDLANALPQKSLSSRLTHFYIFFVFVHIFTLFWKPCPDLGQIPMFQKKYVNICKNL